MKKDAVLTTIAIIVVAGLCFGLAAVRPPFQPTKSTPFTIGTTGPTVNGKVVMRVNGEPVTEAEFQAAFAQMPDEMKQQFAFGPGKQAFAEQFVRMKLLEQEGRKMGLDKDPNVEAQLDADRTNIVARATADKLVANPTAQAVQSFYQQNVDKFGTLDVSHILIAYQGGSVPPRPGGQPLSEVQATNLALKIYAELRKGADFGKLATQYSDDASTLDQGGHLGDITRGMLPPEIETRVWDIPTGQFSSPIPSRFGIHIFKVNARKTAPLAQVKEAISRHVKQQNTADRVEILRKNAKVEFDPKFFPDAKSWPSNNPSRGKQPS